MTFNTTSNIITELYDLCMKIDTYWVCALPLNNSIEPKYQNYLKADMAIKRANQIIDELCQEIKNLSLMESSSGVNINDEKIEKYLGLLMVDDLPLDCLMTIIQELYGMHNSIPNSTSINQLTHE